MTPPNLSVASDQEIVALARQGREDACREIERRYRRPVLGVIYHVVGNEERAEDLAQETFVKVFSTLDRYRPERRLAPWILAIAHNTACHYLDLKRFDSPTSPFADTPGAVDRAAIAAPDPYATPTPDPYPREAAAALKRAIRRLKPEYRESLRLRYVEGRSYERIAEIMKVPVGTVGSYLTRARLALKKEMGD